MRNADVVVNLVGILFERGRQRFDAVQAEGAETVARAAAAAGARMVHVSAIGAEEHSSSHYARSKAEGERRVAAALPQAVIVPPSIVFGTEDEFFNRFAAIARISPVLPLPGRGHTRFQPVFAGDVAEAIAKTVDGEAKPGTIYEFGGPDIRTFKELMEFLSPPSSAAACSCRCLSRYEAASGISAIPAEAAAHPRPGGTAQARQRGLRGRA